MTLYGASPKFCCYTDATAATAAAAAYWTPSVVCPPAFVPHHVTFAFGEDMSGGVNAHKKLG